ncbi:hypothetical protein C7M84_009479 [Penaeus vannamei]|uniref:Uncharacterized protein n=1 Tax=Penaeus vannamei TaxID=6689 RepID=A0A3R7PHN3_PENVA|nr:hypothetical protein C7M84_009479 [Penaeus vannamei]
MSLSPSPNKSKYHMRRALKLTAVALVVVLVFSWRYGGQSAPVLHPAAVESGERIEEKEPLAAVHIYDRHEEDVSATSQVNEGSWAPSYRDENSSGNTQSSIPSLLDYYDEDKSTEGGLGQGDDAEEDKNGFFNIFNFFGGQEDSVEDGMSPEGGSEEKMQGGNATEVLTDGTKAEDGGINVAGNNQSSVAELSQNATVEGEAQQDSKGEGEASASSSAAKAEDDVSKVPSEVQPSIAPDVEKAVVEGSDVGTTKTDAEQIAEPDNGSTKVDAEIENSATDRTFQSRDRTTRERPNFPEKRTLNFPNTEDRLPNHTDVIEDSIGRLGDLIGGIRDVVEVLKKTKDTPPVSEGGEDPQQQQVGGAAGNLTSAKHEALKPGGKLHGHISELLMLTGHLTDLLRESQKGKEEQDKLQTKDSTEGFLQPASVSQGTEAQDKQMGEPIASPANPDEPIAPHTNPDQMKILEVTPMETETQDENKQVLETVPETLAPSDVKENPVNQTQEPADLLDPRYPSDEAGTSDTVKRASGSTEREPVANGWLETQTPLQNPITNLLERDGPYVEPAAAVQVQEGERVDPSKIQEITGEIQETGTLQEQMHERVEPVAIIQEGERLEPVDAYKQEAATNTLQEQASDLVEPVAIQQEGERVEPVNTLQEQAGEQMKPISMLEKQGEPMQPVEPENTLQEQADKPVEPAGVIQEVSRVEPIVDGIQGGEPAEQVNTLQEQTGEHLEPGNTVQEETGVRSQSTDALQREAGELREPVNAALEPASERLEPANEFQEPPNERTEPVPAAQEPTTNAEEPKYQNREPVSEGNGDQVDNVHNMLTNLKNMVHGLHSRLDNIPTKNQGNATSEPGENRLSGGRFSEQPTDEPGRRAASTTEPLP